MSAPQIGLDQVMLLSSAMFFALLLALAALHKVLHWHEYRDQLRDYQVLPEAGQWLVAPLLPLLECALALLWLAGAARSWVAPATALLLLVYGLAMGWNLARGRDMIDCGCGGDGQPIRRALVVRNLVLAASALLTGIGGATARPLLVLDFINTAAAGLALYGCYLAVNQLLANNPPQRLAR